MPVRIRKGTIGRKRRPQKGKESRATRVRDLVHGYVLLTDVEVDVMNHPLFQRLRHIRQNDIASYVYPSLNISRFEHSLGCLHVAGKMAVALRSHAKRWKSYRRTSYLEPDVFDQICRLYAMLHDIGHLPLSHLFEVAFDAYAFAKAPKRDLSDWCRQWFGRAGFHKLHEACGSQLATLILTDGCAG